MWTIEYHAARPGQRGCFGYESTSPGVRAVPRFSRFLREGWPARRFARILADLTMQSPTVALFDIDGTLIVTGGTGRRSVNRAFSKMYGRADACDSFGFDGMTDRSIARMGLSAWTPLRAVRYSTPASRDLEWGPIALRLRPPGTRRKACDEDPSWH